MSDELTFLEKSQEDLRAEILKIAKEETGLENRRPAGVLQGFIEVLTRLVFSLYQNVLNTIYRQADPEKKTGFWLDLWGLQSGVKRNGVERTRGNVSVTSYASGVVPVGHWLKAEGTSLKFKVAKETSFNASTFALPVQAEHPGRLYNLPSGVNLVFTKVVYGIERAKTEVAWITENGRDREDDASYYKRIKLKWASLGDGNPPARFELVAASTPGVSEAKVIRTPRGNGTIDIFIAPTSAEKVPSVKAAVEKAMADAGMVCRDLLVKWHSDLKRNFHIEFRGPYTAQAVELEARAFILQVPMGGTLEKRRLYDHLDAKFPLLNRLEIVKPDRDIEATGTAQLVEKIIPPSPDDQSGLSFKVVKNV